MIITPTSVQPYDDAGLRLEIIFESVPYLDLLTRSDGSHRQAQAIDTEIRLAMEELVGFSKLPVIASDDRRRMVSYDEHESKKRGYAVFRYDVNRLDEAERALQLLRNWQPNITALDAMPDG